MRNSIILLVVVLTFSQIKIMAQEIPNGDFEVWDYYNTWTLEPEHWTTMNGQLIESTIPDSMAYSGQLAMKVTPVPIGVGEEGIATVEVPMGGVPDALRFYVKYWRTVTAGAGVNIDFYYEDDLLYYESYWVQDTASAWTEVIIPFEPIDIALTHAVISVYVVVGDLVAGDGWISVDEMNFGPLGIEEQDLFDEVEVYPNPSEGIITLPVSVFGVEYQVLDAVGKIINSGIAEEILDLTQLARGTYSITFQNENGLVGGSQVILK